MNDEGTSAIQWLIVGLVFVFFAIALLMLCEDIEGQELTPTSRPTAIFTPTMYIYLPMVGKAEDATGTPTPRPTLVGR